MQRLKNIFDSTASGGNKKNVGKILDIEDELSSVDRKSIVLGEALRIQKESHPHKASPKLEKPKWENMERELREAVRNGEHMYLLFPDLDGSSESESRESLLKRLSLPQRILLHDYERDLCDFPGEQDRKEDDIVKIVRCSDPRKLQRELNEFASDPRHAHVCMLIRDAMRPPQPRLSSSVHSMQGVSTQKEHWLRKRGAEMGHNWGADAYGALESDDMFQEYDDIAQYFKKIEDLLRSDDSIQNEYDVNEFRRSELLKEESEIPGVSVALQKRLYELRYQEEWEHPASCKNFRRQDITDLCKASMRDAR
jgi:hypothetical protein